MRVGRLIAATIVAAGVVLGSPAIADAQSPPSVLPTEITQARPPAPAPAVRGNVLARTGADVGQYVLLGSALAAGGAVLVVGARKRRSATA